MALFIVIAKAPRVDLRLHRLPVINRGLHVEQPSKGFRRSFCGGFRTSLIAHHGPRIRTLRSGPGDASPRDDDPGLEVLEADCVDGDFVACDLLFLVSPIGSDAEHIGFTCGNRNSVGGLPDCRSRLDAVP